MNAKFFALVAGFGCVSLAIIVQAIVPATMEETRVADVTKTVRTPLGLLEDVKGETDPFDELTSRGRAIYIREGCWYCHSQYVRPVAGEERRWGLVSQVGEYAYEQPHLFGTRRIGPDLTRIGGKYGDDWHKSHYFDPRVIVPDSVMPRFIWLYEKKDGVDVPTEEGEALIAYIQSRGMSRGKWRDEYSYQIAEAGSSSVASSASVVHGAEVYQLRCQGCHGEKGDGKGAAAAFFTKAQPRDFTAGVYKFRSTPSGSLPLDSDLYRTITVGVRGTAMPTWANLAEDDRWDVIHFIKTFSEAFQTDTPEPPIYVAKAPQPDEKLLAHGKELYDMYQCWQCHGKEGLGDGPSAETLTDDSGAKILPANFTTGIFKVGPRPEDINRTMRTGLNGTPMPSYESLLTEEEDQWALSYYILSLSADMK